MDPKNNFIEYSLGYSAPSKRERELQVKTLVGALLDEGPRLEPLSISYVRSKSPINCPIYKVFDGDKTPFGKLILDMDPKASLFAAPMGRNSTRKFAILNYMGKTFAVYQIRAEMATTIGIVDTSTMVLSKVNNQGAVRTSIMVDLAEMEKLPLLLNDTAVIKNKHLKKRLYKRLGYIL